MLLDIIRNSAYSPREKLLTLTAAVLAIGLSIMLHEIAHGFAAMKQGDYTAKYAGRLTLNPVVHFDILGIIMFAVVGLGWAKPVPVDSRNFKNFKKGVFWVSIAGVLTNFLLAAIAFLLFTLLYVPIAQGLMVGNVFAIFGEQFLIYLLLVNLSLMAFNLLPIYPLDGFRLVENFLKPNNKFVMFMRKNGTSIFFLLIVLGIFADNLNMPFLDLLGN